MAEPQRTETEPGTIETKLTRLLDIQVPVLQAPMAGSIAGPELVGAVSNAGGLGMLPLWMTEPKDIPGEVERVRGLTNRPFAVSVNCQWDMTDRVAAAMDCGASLIHFFWGDPSPYLPAVHRAGARAMLTVAGAEETRRAADNGVQVFIAQAWEAGGHVWSKVGGMALIPAVADAAGSLPVVAAGSITDGRGLAAALMLGASGVLMGSRFVVSQECNVRRDYQEAIIAAGENDTDYNTLFDIGWEDAPLRCLRTPTVQEWDKAGRPAAGARPHEGDIIGHLPDGKPLPRYHIMPPVNGVEGNVIDFALYAGQGIGLIRGVKPAADIVADIVAEARAVIRDRAAMIR